MSPGRVDPLSELTVRVEEVRRDIELLKRQQENLTQSVQELVGTFRVLAMHLGISTDSYRPGGSGGVKKDAKEKDSPPAGFG